MLFGRMASVNRQYMIQRNGVVMRSVPVAVKSEEPHSSVGDGDQQPSVRVPQAARGTAHRLPRSRNVRHHATAAQAAIDAGVPQLTINNQGNPKG